ncbi:MAG TPA: ferritin-like domain-containing protein [candidate division Zixibacteria bacterium]|nr:ferritin-like domain-containing protein [candidate division Zixibacteria bacterium]
MPVTKKKLISLLNEDLKWEFAAAIQYVQHAAVMTGPQYEGVIKELIVHSTEEMQHAVTLAEQIDYLGGVPTTGVEKIETSTNSKTMLEQDLAGEQHAVSRYRERIRQAEELRMYGLRRMLEDILIMEEEHERDLQTALEL